MCLFANRSSSSTHIMVLLKITFVLLCTPFLSPLAQRWWFAVRALWLRCETRVSAEPAGALQTLFFAWNTVQHDWKRNEAMTKWHANFKIDKWGVRFNNRTLRIFSVMAELIVRILFVLVPVYNTEWWAENEWIQSVLGIVFSTN